jgi:guanylate kinase
MKGLFITGTSGVGKSFLELELSKNDNFAFLTKYTDRPPRPTEDPKIVTAISEEELANLKNNDKLIFDLHYAGHNYGWLKSDAEKYSNKIITMNITLESVSDAIARIPNFPVLLLKIDISNFSLLENRLKKRENYEQLDQDQKHKIDKIIKERIDLAHQSYKEINKYADLIRSHNGLVYDIIDDNTLFDIVIPGIYKYFGIDR